jgi:hypothetical protein
MMTESLRIQRRKNNLSYNAHWFHPTGIPNLDLETKKIYLDLKSNYYLGYIAHIQLIKKKSPHTGRQTKRSPINAS